MSIISELHTTRREMLAGHAREALAKLAEYDARFASLSIVRGECHYVLGQWNDAVREFEEALRLSPNSPRATILLELSAEMMGLSKTMRPAPTVEQLLGIPPEVEQVPSFPKFEPSRELSEESPRANVVSDEIGLVSETLAEVMIGQAKFDEARKVYIQLARLNPDRYEYFRDKITALDGNISQ